MTRRIEAKPSTTFATKQSQGEYVTGLIYIDEHSPEFHSVNATSSVPLNQLPYEKLTPGNGSMSKILSRYR